MFEDDIVIEHGRWCIERMLPPERAISQESAAVHAANIAKVERIMDERRAYLGR